MTNLYLIRHGEAWANVQPILAGMQGDKGLTPRGVKQAERLRDRLAHGELQADVLIASTLPRARQTAEIIQPALGVPIILDDEVQELRLGEVDGMTNQEAWAIFGPPDFEQYPLRPIAPGGESWGGFMLRVAEALTRITSEHAGKSIVLVCHGGVIDGAFMHFFQMPSNVLPPTDFHTRNTSLTHWEQVHRRGRLLWRLNSYNDIAHLHDIGATESVRWEDTDLQAPGGHPASPVPTE
ncbi:histidine phosphatase family protein [Candidatus Chloroploca sp. M-50]|uniref:Histidine phosphatase family protein n=1 Tax=Candidatus Chloroploca mongolica TaxID=2528176 RepID=A0ABS4DDY6_9CHLR|nr:histidine phosphatase family protein [Candidatus Chloroploca mongolica]MBP1467662.1 histidine phosphatase family protein [Candidatus Chloroploca mongolica]